MSRFRSALRQTARVTLDRLRKRGTFALAFYALFALFLTGLHLLFVTSLLGGGESAVVHSASPPFTPSAPPPAEAPAAEVLRTVEGEMEKGSGFSDNLIRAGLNAGQAAEVTAHLAPRLDFRRLHAGDRFTLSFGSGDRLARFAYRTGPLEEVWLERTPAGWESGEARLPSETRVEVVTGSIETSLFESLEKLGEKDRLAMDFVDIFAWDIDFTHELRKGDEFRIVTEKVYRDGRFLLYGRILAAEYRDSEELHRAFYYPYPAGDGDYYSPEGESLRKTFLKAPVSYSRISSRYGRRLHPILKRVQAHRGVDYAAPSGTPVWAPAEGTVLGVSYDSRNGRMVEIRHPNGYQTYFLHLSRVAGGVKRGKKVKQKDVIGYVGATGRATGPHLDYRMKKNGRWVDPLREKFPPGRPLPAAHREGFAQFQDWLDDRLSRAEGSLLAATDRQP